jgi:hypothetical protein
MAKQQRPEQRAQREIRVREESTHETPMTPPVSVGDRVRAKTTNRTGEVTHVEDYGAGDQVTVSYDDAPQDVYLTMPARDGVQLPRELVDHE